MKPKGRTYAAKGLIEWLLNEGARVCVVDPLGVWGGGSRRAWAPPLGILLEGAGASAAETCADPLLTSREQVSALERRLRQHERELAAARARVAELEAASAGDC